MSRTDSAAPRWLLGPVLLIVAILVWAIVDRTAGIGPFSKAQATMFLAVPLLLLSPGATAIGVRSSAVRYSALIDAGLSLVVGFVLFGLLVGTSGNGGCGQPLGFQTFTRAAPVAVVAAVAYRLSIWAADRTGPTRRPLVALGTGAAVAAGAAVTTVAAFLEAYPVVSCAIPA